jgi:LacI family transcriptional regulator
MISGPSEGPGSTTFSRSETIEGFMSTLLALGHAVDPEMIVAGNYRYDGGRDAMERLLDRDPNPDAVFVDNDLMALGAMQVIRERGVRVPDDIGIVGFDNIPGAELTSVPLTTLAVPRVEMGEAAADHLLERIADPVASKPVRRFFGTQLIIRQSSTGPGEPIPEVESAILKQE